jgi:hypothetical protein
VSRDPASGEAYEITLGRRVGRRTLALFPGLEVTELSGEGTRIRGTFADQAGLHGALAWIRDLGIPLVEVRRLPPDDGRALP